MKLKIKVNVDTGALLPNRNRLEVIIREVTPRREILQLNTIQIHMETNLNFRAPSTSDKVA